MITKENILILETRQELEEYMKKYKCNSPKHLNDVLWFEYGIILINRVK